ncbi:MAG: AmmeMemoRadiSam system radical SAM enzyme [Thermodesulfobacteriota bacterium]|nr:AmmeMemoRadiSam system radical SAM enzyme [Thermodesulfobacteriota bacterium]
MEAYLYEKLAEDKVACHLCGYRCVVKPDGYGRCKVRQNIGGSLQTLVYGRLIAINPDPIEKKPLYHFMPGTLSYSIATVGCNFRCDFCQNMDISQMPRGTGKIAGTDYSPAEVVADALRTGCRSIAYTYTEPTVFFEFAHDTARLAREKGLKNLFVSNGYMTPEAIDMIAPYLDAANIDLKAFDDAFYQEHCGARFEPVKESLAHLKEKGVFVEVTTLLIPGMNDSAGEIEAAARFIADRLGAETPWHLSRFHPAYKMDDVSPTPVGTLTRAYDIGKAAGLKYIYIGNVPGHDGENTYCAECGELVIERAGFFNVKTDKVKNGCCAYCGNILPGVDL